MHFGIHSRCTRRGVLGWLPLGLLVPRVAEAAGPEPVTAERIRAAQPAVARLVTQRGTGTGFLVRRDGVMLTALHVVADSPGAWAHFPAGKVCPVQGVIATYPERDLAVLKLREQDLPASARPVPIRRELPPVSSAVAAIGYPGGEECEIARGEVLDPTGGTRLQLYAGVRPGYSGGLLLNSAGEAVGLVTSGLQREKLSFAASLTPVASLPSPLPELVTLEELSRRQEESPEQWCLRAMGILHFWRDREDETHEARSATEWALHQYNRARIQRPGFELAHFNAGNCYWALGKPREALAAFQRTLQITPNHLAARLVLADIHLDQRQVAEAEAAVRAVLQQRPSLAPAHRRLAACYGFRKQWSAAEAELQTALAEDPEYVNARLDLGRLLLTTGRRERALAELRRVQELKTLDAEQWVRLGKALAELKQYREAVEAHDAALQSRPHYAEAHYALGVAHLELGNRDRARRAYEALENVNSPLARKLEALLQK